jgi:hypothetical protein
MEIKRLEPLQKDDLRHPSFSIVVVLAPNTVHVNVLKQSGDLYLPMIHNGSLSFQSSLQLTVRVSRSLFYLRPWSCLATSELSA